MANLLDLFGVVPKAYGGLLDEEELRRLKSQSQQNALMTAASALLQAGAPSKTPTNTGLALLQGLQQGRQGFQESMGGGLKEMLTIQQLQEAKAAKERAKQVEELLPQLFGQQAIGAESVSASPMSVSGLGALKAYQPTSIAGTQIGADMSVAPGMEVTGTAADVLGRFNRPEAQMSVPVMGQVPVDQALQKLLKIGGPEALKGIEAYSTLRDVGKPEYLTAGNTVLQKNPEGGLSVAYQAKEKPDYTSDYKNYLESVSQGYTGSFMDYQTSLKRAGATNINMPSEGERKGSMFQQSMQNATGVINSLPIDMSSKTNQAAFSAAGGVGNVAVPPAIQQYRQAADQWSEAYLRVKTGAAATPGEVELNNRTFFPVFGDSKATIEQKARMRAQAEKDMGIIAGRAEKPAPPPAEAPVTLTLPDGRTATFKNKKDAEAFKKAAGL